MVNLIFCLLTSHLGEADPYCDMLTYYEIEQVFLGKRLVFGIFGLDYERDECVQATSQSPMIHFAILPSYCHGIK